jgi:CrcB protein
MMFLYAACGGAIGAALRYLVSIKLLFPFGTLAENGIGSFFIGVAFVILIAKGADRMIVFAMTEVLGEFTTFSAFSLDTLKLLEAGRMVFAGGYVVASVVLSLAAAFSCILLTRGVWG